MVSPTASPKRPRTVLSQLIRLVYVAASEPTVAEALPLSPDPSASIPNTKLPCCQLYPICPPPMKPVFEMEALETVTSCLSSSRKNALLLTPAFCHAAPACAPIYQPAQLADCS